MMTIGFTRRIGTYIIDFKKMLELGMISQQDFNDIEIDEHGAGQPFTMTIVPADLNGRIVLIMPLKESHELEDMNKLLKEADLGKSPLDIMRKALKLIAEGDTSAYAKMTASSALSKVESLKE